MMRLLIRFILPLCFLLPGRLAYTYQSHISYSPQPGFESTAQTGISAAQSGEGLIYKDAAGNSGNESESIKAVEMEDEDDDDDESAFSKKSSKTGNACISFYAQEAGYIYHTNRLPFCEHLSRSSSNKFLIHRVIRV